MKYEKIKQKYTFYTAKTCSWPLLDPMHPWLDPMHPWTEELYQLSESSGRQAAWISVQNSA